MEKGCERLTGLYAGLRISMKMKIMLSKTSVLPLKWCYAIQL